MNDLRSLMQSQFLTYASYVILERAIPHLYDGLKPVQRRFLHTLFQMDDGKFHKVANVAGQTMMVHPHGEAAIVEALTTLAMKGYLLDTQGNFGNLLTGDSAAAARYIETRLSPLAKETLFNYEITETALSYDGRREEPITLPAKIPLLLMHGAEGIAVGMATRILPHNFGELIKAEIKLLNGGSSKVLPDFQTGGIMDASEYDQGRGRVKLRAKVDIVDPKTIVIREICYGTTTESLIRSIDEAAKKGKIKIDQINDYTSDKVEIEIKLPRGQYAEEMKDALFAFTECEVSLNSSIVVIVDRFPRELTTHEILSLHSEKLKEYFTLELKLEKKKLLDKIYSATLEQIFIGERLYKKIEGVKSQEKILPTVEASLKPYHKMLDRLPKEEDIARLLSIPIRRISGFDIEKNKSDILACQKRIKEVEKHLKEIVKYTINYLESILAKYQKEFPRKTKIKEIDEIDRRAVETKQVKVRFDPKTGFIGTKVSEGEVITCTNFDKLLIFLEEGTYKVINIPEKEYVKNPKFVGVADKKTVFNAIYKDPKTHLGFVKRFIVKQFILDKEYRFFEKGHHLEYLSPEPSPKLLIHLIPKLRQKTSKLQLSFADYMVKGVLAKGLKIAPRGIKKVEQG